MSFMYKAITQDVAVTADVLDFAVAEGNIYSNSFEKVTDEITLAHDKISKLSNQLLNQEKQIRKNRWLSGRKKRR